MRGALVGAAVGAFLRGAIAAAHLDTFTTALIPVVLLSALVGGAIGFVAGLPGTLGRGAALGAAVAALAYLITAPVAMLFEFMRTGTAASFVEIVASGALAGAAGGLAAKQARHQRPA